MARIVYGISGEGSGHSSRAREILTHLIGAGHEIRAVSYDRGYENLKDDFDVFETEGLHIASEDNKVSVVKTFADNLLRLPDGIGRTRAMRRELFKAFRPDCVITDFEPTTAYMAQAYGLPLISLDNQHRMRYMRYRVPRGLHKEALMTETVIRAMVPSPDVALVTTFFFGEVKNDRTFLFEPILRQAVLELEPTLGDHVLCYFTQDFGSFIEHLAAFPRERFVVYGQPESVRTDNVEPRPFSRERFLADLASARAVIATAGFTLMTEALYLHKPYLALPMAGQFEQELNAALLEQLGYGRNGRQATEQTVGDFLYRLPEYDGKLREYRTGGNVAIKARLDELLASDCALLKNFQRAAR